jgi:hypothetical protein
MGQRTQRQPKSARPCHNCRKPKGPVLQNTFGKAVAAPTDKRGFVMSEFDRSGVSRCGMVYGHGGGYPQGRPHGFTRVLNHHAHPSCFKTRLVASESRKGAKTMTKVIPLVRTAAPIITASRCAAPIQSQADTTDPHVIALHAAAENALASALHLLRSIDCDPAKLQQATGRAMRATTLLKRACAAQAEGAAA